MGPNFGLPPQCRNLEMDTMIGSCLGTVLQSELYEKKVINKIKVEIDI